MWAKAEPVERSLDGNACFPGLAFSMILAEKDWEKEWLDLRREALEHVREALQLGMNPAVLESELLFTTLRKDQEFTHLIDQAKQKMAEHPRPALWLEPFLDPFAEDGN
jgi:hypothetical protein